MSAPKQILPGATYLVTRRCSQRQFLLRPSKKINNVFWFALAVAARRYRIRVHVFCVMSNHAHLLVTDPHAQLPRFMQFLNAIVARAVNASLGRWENLWNSTGYSAVRVVSPEDMVAKAAYALGNPVVSGLVRSGRLWPGLWSDPDRIGAAEIEVRRPDHFFSKTRSALPEKLGLELTAPPAFACAVDFRTRVIAALAAIEREAARKFAVRGFLGAAGVLAQKPTARPRSRELRRGLNPRIACRDKWKRIEALQSAKAFIRDYRAAWKARRAGDLTAVFPAGTYLLRVLHGVPCASAG
jgi:REP element-mobilizing transposase RayT